jgi:ABC-type glycerol-3-phosphate transport system substrate-binding protein
MSVSTKRRTAVGAAVAAALLVAGCGSSDNSSGNADGKTTINVGLFGTFGFKEAGLYDEYMKDHPNIKIVEQSVEQSADYYKALQTHLAANSGLADIQGIEIGFVADVVDNHAQQFVDFSKTHDAAAVKKTFYPWKYDEATSHDGRVVGLGTDAGPQAMCFRRDLFQQAGLPTDRNQLGAMWADWNGFIDVGKQYEASPTKPANSKFLDSAASIFSSAVRQGDTAYADENGKPILETSDGVQSAWKYATTAATAGITAGLTQFGDQWNSAFANGAFATIACPAWMLGYITSQAGDQASGTWDVAPLPGKASNWGGSWLGVPTASKHQDEAVALATWLTAPEQQVKMFTSQQHFPSSSVAAEDNAVATATSDYFSGAPIGQLFGDSAAHVHRTPISPYDTQIQQAFTTALTNVETKGQDPDKAFQEALANAHEAIGG